MREVSVDASSARAKAATTETLALAVGGWGVEE